MNQRRFRTWYVLAGALAVIGCTQLKTVPAPAFSPTPKPSVDEDGTPSDEESAPAFASPSPSPGASPSPAEDTTAPQVTLANPTATTDFSATAIDVTFNVTVGTGRKVASATLAYDGQTLASYNQHAATYKLDKWNPHQINSAAGNTAPMRFGEHTLTVTVKDDKGTEGKAELKFYKPLKLGAWTAVTAMPGPIAYAMAFSDGAFPAGYMMPWGTATDTLEPMEVATSAYSFNPAGEGSWTTVALSGTSVPRAAYGAAVHPTAAGRAYLVGGRSGSADLRTVELFSPLAKQAEQSLASLTTARSKPAVAVVDGALYVVGGRAGTTALSSLERVKLDASGVPTGTFETLAAAPTARVGAHAIAVDKQLWLVGGGFKAIEVYDPAKNTWGTLVNAANQAIGTPETWSDALLIPAGGRYYFFGGTKEDGAPVTSVHELDPAGKAWRHLGTLPAITGLADVDRPETAMAGCYDNGYFYLMGGISLPEKKLTNKVFKVEAL